MSTPEEKETLRRLVQHVARSFYEPKAIVALDQLSRHVALKDDDLAGRLGVNGKEVTKVMAALVTDRLVQEHRQNELKDGGSRAVGKRYYYLDYARFCNVVKWRVTKMQRTIDKTLRNELDTKGYVCPQCKRTFTPLDADRLLDPATMTFACDVCRAELVDNEDAERVRGSKDRMERFHAALRPVVAGLRASEDMRMPAVEIAAYVRAHLGPADAGPAGGADGAGGKARARGAGPELKVAGTGAANDAGVGVVLSLDGARDGAQEAAARAEAAAARAAQNALPAWHLQSTISGALTSLGVQEQARAAAAAADAGAVAAAQTGDAALRGLGTAGPTPSEPLPAAGPLVVKSEDVKPATDASSDYYDRYYASLAAHSTPSSSAPPDDFGADDEEEDVKPSVEYLDSLNAYRKRARSPEMDLFDEPESKAPRLASAPPTEPALLGEGEDEMEGVPLASGDDPIVYVNGEPMPFSAVTDEHHERMTADEYTAYFDVFQARGG